MSNTPCIRSAYWIGTVKPGHEQSFADLLNQTLIPMMRRLPGVRNARAMWPQLREDSPPEIACQVLVEFDSHDDRARMKASAERAAMRPHVHELAAKFDGHMSHVEFDTV